jgi:signal transduction histidine kinase
MFFIITAVSWLSNFEHERANKRARASEEALKEERDLLEIKVEQRTEQLRVAQAEKVSQLSHFAEFGRLSSGLFHDLAGPLSNMSLNIEQLGLTLHPELPEIKKHLELSIAASKRLERLIVSIKRQIQLNDFKEYFSLNEIIEDVIMLLNYKALKTKVVIEFDAVEKISTYQNPFKFHQIVSNLLSNAIDACQEKTLSTKHSTIQIKLSKKDSTIQLLVQDSGYGIDSKVINKIFDPFFTTKQQNNMGLGLATTKENIERYFNGTISVKTISDKGSTFTVTFEQVASSTTL